MSDCFHMWVQIGRVSDDEFQCLKCHDRVAYKKVNRHTEPIRKPLTEEEIERLLFESHRKPGNHRHNFARLIEKAHGIGSD